MAKAPKPGVTKRAEEIERAQASLTIITRKPVHTGKHQRDVPDTHTLTPGLLSTRERLICRKATGFPFSAFWSEDRVDIDSLIVLWWLARRAAGETTLSFTQADEDWQAADFGHDDVDVEFDDGETEDGEAEVEEHPEG